MNPWRVRVGLFLAGCVVLVGPLRAQWETLQPGFEYRKFVLTGPVEAFVVRMDISNTTAQQNNAIDSMLAQGQFYKTGLANGGRETVSSMVNRYNDSIGYYWQVWGMRNRIICAINGDYWEREWYPSGPFTGRPESGQVQGGWFCRRYDEFSGGSGFFYTVWGVPAIGGDVVNGGGAAPQKVIFADSSEVNLPKVNVERGSDDLVLYTPQWANSTKTAAGGVEVLMRLNRPALPLPHGTSADSCVGTILEVRNGPGDAPLAFDGAVLSGTGSFATTLLNKCTVGQTVRLRMIVRDYGFASRTPVHPAQDWTKAYGSIGVDREMLIASQITNLPSPDTTRDPRTGVAFNASHVFFVVVDGRRAGSIGMTFGELGLFMRDSLGATHGCSLDGGGSSAMWVEGRGIVNVPSDGSERATVNGLMMAAVQPLSKTLTFAGGAPVKTISTTNMRSGPGLNYPVTITLAAHQAGHVISHAMNGVRASGQNWWLFSDGATTGWVSESALQSMAGVQGCEIY